MEDKVAILRHSMLTQLTVIKNALSFILEGRTGEISAQTKQFLEEAYKRNEELINLAISTREEKENG